MRPKRIIFWLGEPSSHQSSYLRALAGLLSDKTVVGVFQQGLQTERLALGWRVPDLGRMKMVMSPDERQSKRSLYANRLGACTYFGDCGCAWRNSSMVEMHRRRGSGALPIEIIAHIEDGTERPVAPSLQDRPTAYIRSDNHESIATHVRRNG